ncbi:MAG: hypothetical protein AAGA60_31020 [Cyanobacteria bacterium P01_E01_bin.42]
MVVAIAPLETKTRSLFFTASSSLSVTAPVHYQHQCPFAWDVGVSAFPK